MLLINYPQLQALPHHLSWYKAAPRDTHRSLGFAQINHRTKDVPGLCLCSRAAFPAPAGSVPVWTGQQGVLCDQALTPGPSPFPNPFPSKGHQHPVPILGLLILGKKLHSL